jgi:hypothetical protein
MAWSSGLLTFIYANASFTSWISMSKALSEISVDCEMPMKDLKFSYPPIETII